MERTTAGGQLQSVGLVVNCYERTYRDVLRPGYFPNVAASNLYGFAEIVVLVNNVRDEQDAEYRARRLVRANEISSYSFVKDQIADAVAHAQLPPRALARRPFLLDYGLVMPHVVKTDLILGWDAETVLDQPRNWIEPASRLLAARPDVLTVGLNWHPGVDGMDELESETIVRLGEFNLNYGFSDQLFLMSRADMLGVRWRTFSPAAVVRHAPHPYTFEYRMESYQRASRRMRATLRTVTYSTREVPGGVIRRTSPELRDKVQLLVLRAFEKGIVDRIPRSCGPRFSK